MQIAVCDDNEYILRELKEQLEALPIVRNISAFSDLSHFWLSLENGKEYDAVLMDIDWDQKSTGMDAAEKIYKANPKTKIIFVTGYGQQYSQRIFLRQANLSGFLTKPVDPILLKANLQKIADELPFAEQPLLVLKQRGEIISIPLREICFMESRDHVVEIHTVRESVTAYDRLDSILPCVPTDFYRCHKSYIVNMRQIQRFQENEIIMKNGASVPISRSKQVGTKEAYFSYIRNSF